jgi:ATP-dependent RNA helicase RhlE
VDGISHVVNYDFPMHSEDYVHRIGRTGRANQIGDAISFVSQDDYGSLKSLERFIGRGIVRKKAEDFDYHQPAPPRLPEAPRGPRSGGGGGGGGRGQQQRRSQGGGGGGGRRDDRGQVGYRFR